MDTVFHLARLYNLTMYDAMYLELALRLGLPLATLDRRLAQAASDAGVETLAMTTQHQENPSNDRPT